MVAALVVTGQSVVCCGHLVFYVGQTVGGSLAGHWVGMAGQAVCFTGHWVA